jgi:hypothetical protein
MANSVFLFPGNIVYSGSVTASGFLAGDGSAAAPSYSFINEPTKGFFSVTTQEVDYVPSGGHRTIAFLGAGIGLEKDTTIGWTSVGFNPGTTQDTILGRGGAGKLTLTGTTPMIQLGGTTSSFTAIKQNGSGLDLRKADDSGYASFNASDVTINVGTYRVAGVVLISTTAPTISSGFGTSPSIVNNNGTPAFTINVGTGGTASSGVIGMPAAANGWNAYVVNITAQAANRADQHTVLTASGTNSITVQNQTISTGAALAWTASDILRVIAMAY